eukprot:gnl/MRDRNA2_/MRDRNA2_88832_c0_seq1.p1 gnl/MRDRNA2_/MRDRNA2_88832_c0~~gnl/MRDRNA2_/MRDRNA2_88832_c0_seq1.p1  ORF type:complete len:323 (-),score=134.95 gnl/MRDRNA2_/MRDRNA2_88832_c0_seq1:7-975(-)
MTMKLNQVASKICILCGLVPAARALDTHPSSHLSQVNSHMKMRIDPELDPASHEKFFKKDYPDDVRAPTFHHFDHPYPEVQDSDHYDKDYVQDENDDKGEWEAQWGYDSKKNKLMNEKEQLKEALAKKLKEEQEWKDAVAAEKAAEKEAREAEKALKDAEAHEANMNKNHSSINGTIDAKADEVEAEVKDLEDCKKQLMKARKELKALLEEKEGIAKSEADAEKDEESKEDGEMSAEKKEELAEKKVEEEHQEYKDAEKDYEKQKDDVKKAEDDLEVAAKKLRKFRSADPDGGVYSTKSDATGFKNILSCTLVSLFLLQMLF